MILLASQSPIRLQLLTNARVNCRAVPAPFNEELAKSHAAALAPKDLAQHLALGKSLAASEAHPGSFVIGADQTLEFEGRQLNKAQTIDEARQQLRHLRGHSHTLHAAVSVAHNKQPCFQHVSQSTLHMRNFSDSFLEDYLKTEGDSILQSVGCYHYEGRGIQLFEHIEGDYFSILGLPILPLLAFLRHSGQIAQ
jgi:septum formation protein